MIVWEKKENLIFSIYRIQFLNCICTYLITQIFMYLTDSFSYKISFETNIVFVLKFLSEDIHEINSTITFLYTFKYIIQKYSFVF